MFENRLFKNDHGFTDIFLDCFIQHEPWVMRNGTGYKGFIVDLLEELSPLSKFQYKLQLTSTRQGSVDYIHGHYDSVIDDVERKVSVLCQLLTSEEFDHLVTSLNVLF